MLKKINIIGLENYQSSIHQYNKQAIKLTLTYTNNNYDSQISFNTSSLNNENYTAVFEFYHGEHNNIITVTGNDIIMNIIIIEESIKFLLLKNHFMVFKGI